MGTHPLCHADSGSDFDVRSSDLWAVGFRFVNNNSRPPGVTQRGGPQFRPVAMLSLLYFAGFFIVFGFLLVAPELSDALETAPVDPESYETVKQSVRTAFRPRIPIALVLALATTAGGGHFKLLPGLRF